MRCDLTEAAMTMHWIHSKGVRWRLKVVINAIVLPRNIDTMCCHPEQQAVSYLQVQGRCGD